MAFPIKLEAVYPTVDASPARPLPTPPSVPEDGFNIESTIEDMAEAEPPAIPPTVLETFYVRELDRFAAYPTREDATFVAVPTMWEAVLPADVTI